MVSSAEHRCEGILLYSEREIPVSLPGGVTEVCSFPERAWCPVCGLLYDATVIRKQMEERNAIKNHS